MHDPVLRLIQEIARALQHELHLVNGERDMTISLDTRGLQNRAEERLSFQRDTSTMINELQTVLPPPEKRTTEHESALFEMKSFAALLREAENLTQILVGRVKPVLDGYLDAVIPISEAYDQRGQRRAWKHASLSFVPSRISTKA